MNKETKKRIERTPLHEQNVIQHDVDEGFYTRTVTDYPGRIQAFLKAGYELVRREGAKISTDQIQDPSVMDDSCIRVVVNKGLREGEGRYGYRMRIPLEFYNEDQTAKLNKISKAEADIDPTNYLAGNVYGQGLVINK